MADSTAGGIKNDSPGTFFSYGKMAAAVVSGLKLGTCANKKGRSHAD